MSIRFSVSRSKLEEIFPPKTRIQKWAELRNTLNVSRGPALGRAPSLMRLLWSVHLIVFLVLLLLLCTKLPARLSFFLSVAITLVAATISMQATKSHVTYIQPAGCTVGDLSRILVTEKPEVSNASEWTRSEISAITRAIIMEQLGISAFDVDDRFVEDLGAD